MPKESMPLIRFANFSISFFLKSISSLLNTQRVTQTCFKHTLNKPIESFFWDFFFEENKNLKYRETMDDLQSIDAHAYSKSSNLEEISQLHRAITIAKAMPSLVVKTLIIMVATTYYLLLALYHYFVPAPLKNIRGQLAAVSERKK